MAVDTVFVRGIRLDASVGTHAWEHQLRQPLEVDIAVDIDTTKLLATGDLSQGADFDRLIAIARGAVTEHVELIETLADAIAREVLDAIPCDVARVEVRKYVPCATAAAHVGVLAVRRRSG